MAIKAMTLAAMGAAVICLSGQAAFASCGAAAAGGSVSSGYHAPSSGGGSVHSGASAPHAFSGGASCATGVTNATALKTLGAAGAHPSPIGGTKHEVHAALVHPNAVKTAGVGATGGHKKPH